jgi:hypothetical protein
VAVPSRPFSEPLSASPFDSSDQSLVRARFCGSSPSSGKGTQLRVRRRSGAERAHLVGTREVPVTQLRSILRKSPRSWTPVSPPPAKAWLARMTSADLSNTTASSASNLCFSRGSRGRHSGKRLDIELTRLARSLRSSRSAARPTRYVRAASRGPIVIGVRCSGPQVAASHASAICRDGLLVSVTCVNADVKDVGPRPGTRHENGSWVGRAS